MNECMPKIATSCKSNVVFMFLIMFTFVYIYIDFNDQVAILDQHGNGLSLVAFEWFQVSYMSVKQCCYPHSRQMDIPVIEFMW